MIVGHKKQWNFLEQSVKLDKISHAYLFSGQEKLGKKTIALQWISLINGWKEDKEQHPDLILIEPEKNTISIAQIRDLIWKLQLTPHSAPFKVAIIDKAHLMGWEAQSSLLKTLEEPKGDTVLILVTSKPEALFSTIRSRCEIIKFYPIPKSEIKKYLKSQKIGEKKAELISSISRGRPGKAVDFIMNPEKLQERKKTIEEFKKILDSSLNLRFHYAKSLSKKEELGTILRIWQEFLRNILLKKIKESSAKNQDSLCQLNNRLKALERIIFLLSRTNINSRLALETLMLEI